MQDHLVQLVICDDGISFDPKHPPASRKQKKRLGLLDMCERANHVGGTVNVKSVAGQGTTITIKIPFGKIRRGSQIQFVENRL
jgi:signal transduction histidine kinase